LAPRAARSSSPRAACSCCAPSRGRCGAQQRCVSGCVCVCECVTAAVSATLLACWHVCCSRGGFRHARGTAAAAAAPAAAEMPASK
jgi:hypothetical protein